MSVENTRSGKKLLKIRVAAGRLPIIPVGKYLFQVHKRHTLKTVFDHTEND